MCVCVYVCVLCMCVKFCQALSLISPCIYGDSAQNHSKDTTIIACYNIAKCGFKVQGVCAYVRACVRACVCVCVCMF